MNASQNSNDGTLKSDNKNNANEQHSLASSIDDQSRFRDIGILMDRLVPKSEQLHKEFSQISTHLNAADHIMRKESAIINNVLQKLDRIEEETANNFNDLKYYANCVGEFEQKLCLLENTLESLPKIDMNMYSNQQRQK
ncbi:MAG: hypothetical protein MHMPM18_001804 [Marteilia pararefringens]